MKTEISAKPPLEDEKMQQRADIQAQTDEAFMACLEIARNTFTHIRGELPDENTNLWKWYILQVYDTFLRLKLAIEEDKK